MKKLLLAIAFTTLFDSAMSQPASHVTETQNEAIEIAIADFLKCRLSKNFNAFSVSIDVISEYAPYKISDDLVVVSILGAETSEPQYYITLTDTLESTRLPTRHVIKDGKLFYWYDSDYGLTDEAIRVFRNYNLADFLENSGLEHILGQEVYGDDFAKGATYYFCKNNPSNYKRVITSIGIGGYKPPMVRCKR